MFNFFKRKSKSNAVTVVDDKQQNDDNTSLKIVTGLAATESARQSTLEAVKKFAKPSKYDRSLLDDGMAKKNIKINAFNSNADVIDPYTGDKLTLTKAEAKAKYGSNWDKHLAESDHKIPLEERYNQTKDNPWLSNDDIKKSSNREDNMQVVSRKFNNAKRSRFQKNLVSDEAYLEKTGLRLSESAKQKAIDIEEKALRKLKQQDFTDSVKNVFKTGHSAGKKAAIYSGTAGITVSGIENVVAVINGEKSPEDALADIAVDGGKAAVNGYVMGNGLTTLNHTLSASSSKFLRALSDSNVPGHIITAVMATGKTIERWGNGEITTQECILELGEKGLSCATAGYTAAVGQALIPIPVVGAVVGGMVGTIMTSNFCNKFIDNLRVKELERKERLRIIAECEQATKEVKAYREQLETYLEAYFQEYQDCFNDALGAIYNGFETGDADNVILGAN